MFLETQTLPDTRTTGMWYFDRGQPGYKLEFKNPETTHRTC